MTHAAFGRQVRLQGLRDLGRPARRRRLGGQRAVGRARGRGRARPAALPPGCSRAASRTASWRSSAECKNRRGTKVRFQPDPRSSARAQPSSRRGSTSMARSKAYLFGGVEIRWTCDPVADRATRTTPAKATFHFPGRPEGLSRRRASRARRQVHRDIFAGKIATSRAATARSNGRSPGSASDGFVSFLLQHHPDPRRRHARGRACAPR